MQPIGMIMPRITHLIILFATLPAFSQSEGALKSFFEGKQVRVKIDMPATHNGIDINYRGTPPLDFKSYSQRLKNYGASLRNGDSVMVTAIRLKGKNIEFQLGGGGYGTLGDDTGTVSLPAISKSRRETDLERDIRDEKDARIRDRLNRELSRVRDDRRRDEERRRAEEARLKENKRREIQEKAMQAGSRFNLWFPNNYLKESVPTPQEIKDMLAEYVDFGSAPISMSQPQPTPTTNLPQLKRGMTPEQVYAIVGRPVDFRDASEGQLSIHTERFYTKTESIEVDFVEGVVIRFRIASR